MVDGRGLSESLVRKCAFSILKCLQLLEREHIVHGDLKLVGIPLISHLHCQPVVVSRWPSYSL